MHRPSLALIAVLCLAFASIAVPAPTTAQQSPPICLDLLTGQGVTATKWLTEPGTLVGTNRRDVLVGSAGSDVIRGLGGNDVICTEPNSVQYPELDLVYGGTGADSITGIGTFYGESGADHFYLIGNGGYVDGGSGNDVIKAFALLTGGDFGVTLLGGSGNDTIYNDGGVLEIDCGSGWDSVVPNDVYLISNCEHTLASS